MYLVQSERTMPRSITVNRRAQRFSNEAATYNALGGAFHQHDPVNFEYGNPPCWLIDDAAHVEEHGGFELPGGSAPAFAERAETLESLARKIGVNPALSATVARRRMPAWPVNLRTPEGKPLVDPPWSACVHRECEDG